LLSIDDLFEERGATGAREKRARDSACAAGTPEPWHGERRGPGSNCCASSEDGCESVSERDDEKRERVGKNWALLS